MAGILRAAQNRARPVNKKKNRPVDPDVAPRMPEAAWDSLRKADKNIQYGVRVLVKDAPNEDQKRVVVLLGEAHVKTPGAAKLGREIINHFEVRGLEGADIDKLWAMKGRAKQDLPYNELQKKLPLEGSTIHEAAKQVKGRVNVPLEKGHEPNLAEQFSGFVLAQAMDQMQQIAGGDPAAMLGAAKQGQKLDQFLKDLPPGAQKAVKIGTNIFMLQNTVGAVAAAKMGDSNWAIAASPFYGGLLVGRNKTMVKNIDGYFDQAGAEKPMLAIVGGAHSEGMSKLLQKQYGYTEVALP